MATNMKLSGSVSQVLSANRVSGALLFCVYQPSHAHPNCFQLRTVMGFPSNATIQTENIATLEQQYHAVTQRLACSRKMPFPAQNL
jgi:hypothetical protein